MRMVDILGSIDAKIENNEKNINKLEELVLQLYRKFTLNCELSKVVMQDIFTIGIGKTPPRKESKWFSKKETDMTWLSISDMGKCNVFAYTSGESLTHEAVAKFNIPIIPPNTVLLSFKLTVGKLAISEREMTTNEAIAHFIAPSEIFTEYLYCYLKDFNYDLLGNTSSIATAVNSKTIKVMDFLMPPQDQLQHFHDITKDYFIKINTLIKENNKLNELKQLYLKKFFG